MSFKTHVSEEAEAMTIRCDIMPYDVCGKIVSMGKDSGGMFSRNRFDLWDEIEVHVLHDNGEERFVVKATIVNVSKKGEGRTEGVGEKDDGWVYTIEIRGEHKDWEDLAFQYMMTHK